jgi:hypothetical protein
MIIEPRAFCGAQRGLAIADDFHALVMMGQERTQAPAGEKILVVGFKQMPRHDEMGLQARNDFNIRHGNEKSRRHSSHLGQETVRFLNMLQYFDANRRVETVFGKGQFPAVDQLMRKAPAGEFRTVGFLHLGAQPIMPIASQVFAVKAKAAADIKHPARRRPDVTADEVEAFRAAAVNRWAGTVNLRAVAQLGFSRHQQSAVVISAVIHPDQPDGLSGERFRGAVGETGPKFKRQGISTRTIVEKTEKAETSAEGGREAVGCGNVRPWEKESALAQHLTLGQHLDSDQGGMALAGKQPAFYSDCQRIAECESGGAIDVKMHSRFGRDRHGIHG